jgi:hypothetical protein
MVQEVAKVTLSGKELEEYVEVWGIGRQNRHKIPSAFAIFEISLIGRGVSESQEPWGHVGERKPNQAVGEVIHEGFLWN